MKPSDLHVISVISNPARYKSRPRLMQEFLAHQATTGVTQWVIEATFGERPAEIIDPSNPHHIQVRCDNEIWIKEAMINRAAHHLPNDWKYMMWLDADVEFVRDDFAMETMQALQHYSTVQPWSHAVDMGPKKETLENHTGFAYQYVTNNKPYTPGYGAFWHPGYAWAWRREAFDAVGGMIDGAICGAGDHHMALALIGKANLSYPYTVTENYKHMVDQWQSRAETHLKRNLGFVPGTILHSFHGPKAKRFYQTRWSIITDNKYDPYVDIVRDSQGMPRLTGNKPKLRDDLRQYMAAREEDSISLT